MNIPLVLRSTSCLGEALVYPCFGPVISRMLLDLSLLWNGRLCGNVWYADLLLSEQSYILFRSVSSYMTGFALLVFTHWPLNPTVSVPVLDGR